MGKLTAAGVRSATHSRRGASDERLSDGDTLYLQLKLNGRKCWVQVLRVAGCRRNVGLGGYPLVTL